MITAISLVFSRYLYLPSPPPGIGARTAYCLVIWSAWLPFTLGYVSIYTCLALTVERWLAVNRPHFYLTLQAKQARKAVVGVWLIGILVNVSTLFRVKYDNETEQCKWKPLKVGNDQLPWLDFTVQSIVPFATMIILYSHIIYTLNRLRFVVGHQNHPVKKVTAMALTTSCVLILGWLPSRISFLLSKFGYVDPNSLFHFCLIILAFVNISVNPFLYGIYCSQFREDYKNIFLGLVKKLSFYQPSENRRNDIEMQGKGRVNKAVNEMDVNQEIQIKRSSHGHKIGCTVGE
ncbi:adenosine receptor A3-like [Dendronephthya gigantea]|uniref:adenosine receptor A3-like n=1 Tax=Dendronephthya gigantea TaxID=151771 RepID=UPI00106D0A07|nr:adenosine receptor A3-like [Dendronephthya gigantea]